MKIRLIFFILFLFISSCAELCFAEAPLVIPADKLPGSNCDRSWCQNMDKGWSYNDDCTKNSDLDYISCQVYKLYGKTFSMVVSGDEKTEGAYIRCNSSSDYADDDCLRRGAFTVTNDISQATPNLKFNALDVNLNAIKDSDGNTYFCPLIRCDVRTEDVAFKVNGSTPFYGKLQQGEYTFQNYVFYRNIRVGDNLCVVLITTLGPVYLGCKAYPPAISPSQQQNACTDAGAHHSKVFFSISSKIVECVRGILDELFIENPNDANRSIFQALQDNLRRAVMTAIVLYVVLFGIKIATGSQIPAKNEVFMFVLKIALVLYFTMGTKGDDGKYHNGLKDLVYDGGMAAMTSFSSYILDAASTGGLCKYTSSDYDKGYSYMALWDSLDCRIAYYLGLYRINFSGDGDPASTVYGIIGFIIPALLSTQLILTLLLIIYGIFIISLVVYFVHFYVIAMIMLGIMVYLGVIMVPLALFSYTKQFYDNWLKAIISYIMQPVIVTAFLALTMMVFDSVIFGNCEFKTTTANINGADYNYWYIDGTPCNDQNDPRCNTKPVKSSCLSSNSCEGGSQPSITSCQDSFGGKFLSGLGSGNLALTSLSSAFFDYVSLNLNFSPTSFVTALLKVILLSILIFLFADNLGSFAADLTSGPNIGKYGSDATKVFSLIKEGFSKLSGAVRNKITGGGKKDDKPGGSGAGRPLVNVVKK